MLPMWISPDGEMPVEMTSGRPAAAISAATRSAQWVAGAPGARMPRER
jgi:hypothetical protein